MRSTRDVSASAMARRIWTRHSSPLPAQSNGKSSKCAVIALSHFDREDMSTWTVSFLFVAGLPCSARCSLMVTTSVNDVHRGLSPVLVRDLKKLADTYDIELMLVYPYAFPAMRMAISVKRGDPTIKNWVEIPTEFLEATGISYHVPVRRLADSSISIAIVERGIVKCCVLRMISSGLFLHDSILEGPSFDNVNDDFVGA